MKPSEKANSFSGTFGNYSVMPYFEDTIKEEKERKDFFKVLTRICLKFNFIQKYLGTKDQGFKHYILLLVKKDVENYVNTLNYPQAIKTRLINLVTIKYREAKKR